MKKLHWMILRSLPGPFFAAFGTLVFLLLLQFLITHLRHLVGRGLPLGVIFELVTYSLAYMVSLAVPMSLMLATLLVFGRLAESEAYAVAKASGVSLLRLTWPLLAVGVGMVGVMTYFNSVTLPETNHRMRALWQDIRTSKPGFELEPGVFYDGLQGYAIRVDAAPAESNELHGVLIFDNTGSGREAMIVADRGELRALPDGSALHLTLHDGEIHRSTGSRFDRVQGARYERISFSRHRLSLDLSDLSFERREEGASRTPRTMRNSQMVQIVDSLEAGLAQRRADLRQRIDETLVPQPGSAPRLARDTTDTEPPLPHDSAMLDGLTAEGQAALIDLALMRARSTRSDVEATVSTLRWEGLRASRFRVEIYKKYAMAAACFVFVLVGIPLGLSIRRRGYGVAIVAAVALFLLYWMLLVQGEKLADRGFIPPWLGMGSPNAVGLLIALYFFGRETRSPVGFRRPRGRRGGGRPADEPENRTREATKEEALP